jgi:hypothetical protein
VKLECLSFSQHVFFSERDPPLQEYFYLTDLTERYQFHWRLSIFSSLGERAGFLHEKTMGLKRPKKRINTVVFPEMIWLVIWKIFYDFPYIGNSNPN